MTTLAADAPRDYELGEHDDQPVIAADIIYEGAAVGDNGSGYARPLVAGDIFLGFADRKADNSVGAAGGTMVRLKRRGQVKLPVASLALTDVGKPVYASDDNAFTLTKGTNSYIGKVKRFVSSGVGIVEFKPSVDISALTAITGGEAPTEAEHNLVITKINEIIGAL